MPEEKTRATTLAFASGRQGSGKSALITNLAQVIGKSGLKALVIDADDNRNPGEEVAYDLFVNHPEQNPNIAFDLKRVPINGLAALHKEARHNYDLILVDTNGGTNIKTIENIAGMANTVILSVIGLNSLEANRKHFVRLGERRSDVLGLINAASNADESALMSTHEEARRWLGDRIVATPLRHHPIMPQLLERGLLVGQDRRSNVGAQQAAAANLEAIWLSFVELSGIDKGRDLKLQDILEVA